MSIRLGIFSTHPIQYFAPLWRRLAGTPGLDVAVHYFSDHSVRGGLDTGFGVPVAWDVPLLQGYAHHFLSRTADLARPASVRIGDVDALFAEGRFDAVLVHGYTYAFERQVVRRAHASGIRTILRGELTDQPPYGGRGALKSLVRNAYLRRFYKYIRAFCYVGEEARLHLVRRGIPPQRMFFSPYSVDTELFERQKLQFDRERERAALHIPPDQFVLLFSDKLIPRKAAAADRRDPSPAAAQPRHTPDAGRRRVARAGVRRRARPAGRPRNTAGLRQPGRDRLLLRRGRRLRPAGAI